MADVTKDAADWLRARVEADRLYADEPKGWNEWEPNDPADPHRIAAQSAVLLWVLDEAERIDALEDGDEYDLGYLAALETVITKTALALGWTR